MQEFNLWISAANATFNSLCTVYNTKHRARMDCGLPVLYSKRLVEGYFVFILLELQKRYNIKFPINVDIDKAISMQFDKLMELLRKFHMITLYYEYIV